MKSNAFCFIVKNTPIEYVYNIIKNLPLRYTHCKQEKTIWEMLCLKYKHPIYIILTVIDLNFEPPRGKNYDTPLFHIMLEQKESDTVVFCKFKWRKWKKYLMLGMTVFSFFIWNLFLLCIIKKFAYRYLIMLIMWTVVPISVIIVWFITNIKHDKLTKKVFCRIIEKEIEHQPSND